jgi:hypothetical protein
VILPHVHRKPSLCSGAAAAAAASAAAVSVTVVDVGWWARDPMLKDSIVQVLEQAGENVWDLGSNRELMPGKDA